MIAVRETGLVYRNPRPELRSRHTWHPTIVRFDDGEMLVTFDIAEADVALDYRTYATHSTDAGATWTAPERVVPDPPGRPTTQSVRSSLMSDGSVVAMGGLMYRDDPEASVVNVPSIGYTEMDLILDPEPRSRSHVEPDRTHRAAARRSGLRGLPRRSPNCATAAGSGRVRRGWAGTATRRTA